MSKASEYDLTNAGWRRPRVLVVERNEAYGTAVIKSLRGLSVCAKHAKTVDEFLDVNSNLLVDLVVLEVEAIDDALDCLRYLRTHFGEGPGTHIIAVSSFAPDSFLVLLQQHGADLHIMKPSEPSALAWEVHLQIKRRIR